MKELKKKMGILCHRPYRNKARLNDVRFQSKERSIYIAPSKSYSEIYDNMKTKILKMNNTVASML
jgi:hypothetical protein